MANGDRIDTFVIGSTIFTDVSLAACARPLEQLGDDVRSDGRASEPEGYTHQKAPLSFEQSTVVRNNERRRRGRTEQRAGLWKRLGLHSINRGAKLSA